EAAGHDQVDPSGQQQLRKVEARSTLPQVDVDATRLVETGRHRLVVATVLGLGAPVGMEGQFIECLRPGRTCEGQQQRSGKEPERRASIQSKGSHHTRWGYAGRESSLSIVTNLGSRRHCNECV